MSSDWTPVVLRKGPASSIPKTATQLAAAKAAGKVETIARVKHTAPANANKLDDNELDDFKHQTVTHDFKLALQKARTAKGWTQADLAKQMNVKQTIIQDYESGKAIPQGAFISQLNRTLGTVLPKIPKQKKKTTEEDD